jgi:hypothetical protein
MVNYSKALIKESGGRIVELTKDILLQKLENTNPSWNSKPETQVFPLITDPRYEGPTGLSGISAETDRGHKDHIKGHGLEVFVSKFFEKFSLEANLGWKIFGNVNIRDERLDVLSDVLQTEPIVFPAYFRLIINFIKYQKS